jgi:hypothetical protein
MTSFKCRVDDVGGADGILGDQNCWRRIMCCAHERKLHHVLCAHIARECSSFAIDCKLLLCFCAHVIHELQESGQYGDLERVRCCVAQLFCSEGALQALVILK